MRDHIDSDTHGGRARSGAVLSIVPADGEAQVSSRTHHPAGRKRAPASRPVPVRTVSHLPEQPGAGRAQRVPERRLVRAAEPLALRFRVRRAVAGAVVVLVTAAVVVGLGLLADTASVAHHAAPRLPQPPHVVVTLLLFAHGWGFWPH